MGGVKKFLFGKGGGSESESGNHAWPAVSGALTPAMGYATQGGGMMANLLGLNGGAAQTEGLSNYANSGGMKFLLDEGTQAVNSNFYARGLGNSGAAMKGLEKYRSGLASTYLNQYMDHLAKLSGIGLGAAGAMSSAGGWSKGNASQGKQGALPSIISAVAAIPGISDRRLKKNIVEVGETEDGVTIYEFDYKQDTMLNLPTGRFIGFMADEVPVEALGPEIKGYLTVKDPAFFPRKVA
jgi:hypothetical protein